MEAHNLAFDLQQSREQLRELLIPDPATARIDADVFPRSTAMQFLFAGLPSLLTMAWQSRSARGAILPQLAQALIQAFVARRR